MPNASSTGQASGVMSAAGSPQANSLMNQVLPNPQGPMPSQSSNQNMLMQQLFQNMQAQQAMQGGAGRTGGGGVPTAGTPQGGLAQMLPMLIGMMGGG